MQLPLAILNEQLAIGIEIHVIVVGIETLAALQDLKLCALLFALKDRWLRCIYRHRNFVAVCKPLMFESMQLLRNSNKASQHRIGYPWDTRSHE